MRLLPVTALLLATACGEAGVYEPYVLPEGSVDLNATPIRVSVYASAVLTQQLESRGVTIDKLEVVASMTATDGFAPTVNLPSDEGKPLVVSALTTGVQDEGSGQPTEVVVLRGYPVGRLNVQVSAFVAGQAEAVGIGCDISRAIDAVPASNRPEIKDTSRVVLSAAAKPCL